MSSEVSAQYDKIYKYCYFKTGDAVLAEDITQETFLRFYKAGKYHEHGKIMAYLYTIAANLIKDSFRRKYTGIIRRYGYFVGSQAGGGKA